MQYPAWILLLGATGAYLAIKLMSTVIYNLYFHPLAKVPGPKIAAATYLYQTYFSLVGPVVRITPDEVHLCDADNYEIINFVGSKYPKSALYDAFGIGYSTFSTRSVETHRIRRGALNPFFSRKMVLQLEHIVQDKAEKVSALTAKAFASGKAMNLHYAFRAVSVDVITEYAFAGCYDLLDRPDLGQHFFEMIQGLGPTMWVFQQWPALQKFALGLPPVIAKALSAPIGQVLEMTEHCRKQCAAVKEVLDSGKTSDERPSIFQALLSPNEKDPDYVVPSVDDLKDEAYSMLAAAADTTGNAMTVSAYKVVSDPEIYAKVKQELEVAFPDANATLDFITLESLPYLSAVIKEGLRLSFGVPGRLPRDVPDGGQVFNGVFIPAGYTVSMSSWVLHQDPEYFPDPQRFDPGRWLDAKEARRIEKAFVPFGKGTRGCVGMPLAYCELYVTLGTLFRRFGDMKSNVLTREDLVYDDHFSGYHPVGATKFHVSSESSGKAE
ncbi:Cytochrome P450 monooxygenase [Hyphodiscus hymeniophilus]|uniref:Cytochrome P450 monooxygenase n=1 Tax=Hyphodiscus hymeniophilus TaxID=353542 RepID=A0A9P7B002_9HELO|nr:Cytochrome P450 monooxygenase [Hyphodiscus hymeniophilus]